MTDSTRSDLTTGDQKPSVAAPKRSREELKAAGFAYDYDLSDPQEIVRLCREAKDYLKLCHYKHGTDWEGRKFAIDAFDALPGILNLAPTPVAHGNHDVQAPAVEAKEA
jgi:hypothetical protein